MRQSSPMPVMTSVTSAPTRSQMFAISLENPIFSARKALAEYLIISALVMVVATIGISRLAGCDSTGRGANDGSSNCCSINAPYS